MACLIIELTVIVFDCQTIVLIPIIPIIIFNKIIDTKIVIGSLNILKTELG